MLLRTSWSELQPLLTCSPGDGEVLSEIAADSIDEADVCVVLHDVCTQSLRHPEMNVRVNAAKVASKLCIKHSAYLRDLLQGSASDGSLLLIDEIDVDFILAEGIELSSKGMPTPTTTSAELYSKEWVASQRAWVAKKIGLSSSEPEVELAAKYLDVASLVNESNDLVDPQHRQGSSRKARKRRREGKQSSHDPPAESSSPSPAAADSTVTSETWLVRLLRHTCLGLLHGDWAVRQGSALGLRSIVAALLDAPADKEPSLPYFLLEDVVCGCLCLTLLDRLVDFEDDAGSSPVREASAALFTALFPHLRPQHRLRMRSALTCMMRASHWSVVCGSLMVYNALFETGALAIDDSLADLCEALNIGLPHAVEDVVRAASQIVQTLSNSLKEMSSEAVDAIVSVCISAGQSTAISSDSILPLCSALATCVALLGRRSVDRVGDVVDRVVGCLRLMLALLRKAQESRPRVPSFQIHDLSRAYEAASVIFQNSGTSGSVFFGISLSDLVTAMIGSLAYVKYDSAAPEDPSELIQVMLKSSHSYSSLARLSRDVASHSNISSSSVVAAVLCSVAGMATEPPSLPFEIKPLNLDWSAFAGNKSLVILSLSQILKELSSGDGLDSEMIFRSAADCIAHLRRSLARQSQTSKSIFRIDGGHAASDALEMLQGFVVVMTDLWVILRQPFIPYELMHQLELLQSELPDLRATTLLNTLNIVKMILANDSLNALRALKIYAKHMVFIPLSRTVLQRSLSSGLLDLIGEPLVIELLEFADEEDFSIFLVVLTELSGLPFLDHFPPQRLLNANISNHALIRILSLASHRFNAENILALEEYGLSVLLLEKCSHDSTTTNDDVILKQLAGLLIRFCSIDFEAGIAAMGRVIQAIGGKMSSIMSGSLRQASCRLLVMLIEHLQLSMFKVYGECLALALRGLGDTDRHIRKSCAAGLRTLISKAGVGKSFIANSSSQDFVLRLLRGNAVANVREDHRLTETIANLTHLVRSYLNFYILFIVRMVSWACGITSGKG